MAQLGGNDHHIQRGQLFLELEPEHSPAAGQIEAFRVFDHQTLIQASASPLKRLFDLSGRMGGDHSSNLEL